MSSRKRFDEDDDGRVIAPMDVDGMPWHNPLASDSGENGEEGDTGSAGEREPVKLTRAESRAYAWGALKAALAVAAVFALVFLLFILFCTEVWFA